jgi:hypothetical protein
MAANAYVAFSLISENGHRRRALPGRSKAGAGAKGIRAIFDDEVSRYVD